MDRADLRRPAVAGRFYPSDPAELEREVAALIGPIAAPARALGAVAPHAGYVYSGRTAGALYAQIEVPERVIVLAPNHTGRGARLSLWARGAFDLPGGAVPVDEELAAALEGRCGLRDDREAHAGEHALEVQLPLLRSRQPKLRVTPIVLGPLDLAQSRALGAELARAIAAAAPEPILVVASSDMNHYLPDGETRARDRRLIDPLLTLDEATLHARVLAEDHSMCGFVPATAMLACVKSLGAREAALCAYATSGDAFGDRDRTVGYASIAIS